MGVDVFQDTCQTGEKTSIFPRHDRKQLAQSIEIVSEREEKLASLVIGFVFLLAKPEFYSHLASWQVVIRTLG
jgi:hypothetical protein